MEARIALLEAKLCAIESRMPSWEARVKTLERNNPLEARLRSMEAAQSALMTSPGSLSVHASAVRSWIAWPFAGIHLIMRWLGQLSRNSGSSHKRGMLSSIAISDPDAISADPEQKAALQLDQRRVSSKMTEQDKGLSEVSDSEFALPSKYCFSLKDGLEGYSQSLVLAPSEMGSVKAVHALSDRAKIALLHREACRRGLDTYIDPQSGYEVFTGHHLKTRDCCGSGCRHCPWGHRNVPGKKSAQERPSQNAVQDPPQGDLPVELAISNAIGNHSQKWTPKSRLYTRKGDAGYTNLYNEEWVLKSMPVYEAIGDVDELNSAVGLAHAFLPPRSDMVSQLEAVQAWLLDIGSALCTPRLSTSNARKLQRTRGVTSSDVAVLENFIDVADARVAQLTNFILPGGSAAAAALHLARTVCRRAERHIWPRLLDGHNDEMIGVFLNRLSDYLFVAARLEAHNAGTPEKQYKIERQVDRWQRQIVNTQRTAK